MSEKSYRQTLLLIQSTEKFESRLFYDFKSLENCIEFVLKSFEDKLRTEYENRAAFTYNLGELYDYLDTIQEIICLVFNEETRTFVPHNKDWIKSKIYKFLNKLVTPVKI